MILDDLLIVMIIAGIGLSVAYLRAEVFLYRRFKAAERRREALQRQLHIKRVRSEQIEMPGQQCTDPSPNQINVFPAMRGLARASRIFIQGRQFHLFSLVRDTARQTAKHGYWHAS